MAGLMVSERDRLVEQARALHDAGHPAQAEDCLRRVLDQDPSHAFALTLMAELAIERRDIDAAICHAQAVLSQQPNFAPALSHLAQALWLAGRLTEGLEPARRAVAVQPGNPLFRVNLGQLCAWLGRREEAEAVVRPVLEQTWHPPEMRARAHGVIGEALTAQGEFDSAQVALEQAITLAPGHEALHMAYAISLLRLGRLREGWDSYRRRHRVAFFFPGQGTGLPGTLWQGQDLTGRTILLRDEQGYGDAIQFFRYIRLLRKAGAARIVLSTFPLLAPLFQASTGLAEVVTAATLDRAPDFHCPTGDLPGGFGTTLETIPADVPYLRPPPEAMETVPALPEGEGPSVGLVWSGDPRHVTDHLRSIPASVFLRIADLPGVRFVSLQNAVRGTDLPALTARPQVARIGETLTDFGQTAALVSQLDLVIAVDTSVAHLAGAMGKPVWLLLPRAPDWRWLIGREDSPWYPTVRLFRAGADGWAPVIERVRQALGEYLDDRRTPPPPLRHRQQRGPRAHHEQE